MSMPKRDAAPAAYSMLQLEAGLSTTSFTSKSSNDSDTSDQLVTQERQVTMQSVAPVQGHPSIMDATQHLPPQNFASVVPGVYRSSYPQAHDLGYLKTLNLKTVVTLVEKEIPEGYRAFLDESGIKHIVFGMAGTKKADIPLPMMSSIISLISDKQNHPMLVHCNQGKHRTGCVVGVLRRFHGWDTQAILDEYTSFAEPKVRPTDVQYLREFQLVNLRHIVAHRQDSVESTLSINHFVLLYVVVVACIILWILTAYGVVSLPIFEPPVRPRVSEI
ncbi:hypothetical protein E8E14_007609 [Neopestalotiopsis sp. 37M]|nr:hypothetical protein E8E14_007609 [Neopestalotiopsis sp. 37M]